MKTLKECSDTAAAVYANTFYVQLVDGGQNLKLTFCEQAGDHLAIRASLLLSRKNAEELQRVAGEILASTYGGAA